MKRIASVLLTALLILSLCSSASAATIYRYGDWDLTPIENTDPAEFSVSAYKGNDTSVTVPNDYGGYAITAIGSSAFAANRSVKEITVPEGFVSVGKEAFMACNALERVTLPSTLTTIGEGAFTAATALTEVNLGDTSVTEIPAGAFVRSGIRSITLPETCTAIRSNAFTACSQLTEITIPDSVTSIGESAFAGCSAVIKCSEGSYAQSYAEQNGITCEATAEPIPDYVRGDADGDGTVTVLDATIIQRLLAALIDDPDGMIARRGDVNGDGADIMDATRIQRWLARFSDSYGIGEIVTNS